MSEELKPCPFCGSDDIHESGDNGYGSFWVICEGCGVSTSEVGIANQAEANARWNTRSTPMAGAEPPKQGEAETEKVVADLVSALGAMLTQFGMDEDEWSKPTFDQARQAYEYARIVMRPMEPHERHALAAKRDLTRGWHERAVALGADGVDEVIRAAEIAKRRGELHTVDGYVSRWTFPSSPSPSVEPAPAEDIKKLLQDPVAVHVAMLRGEIAKPDIRSMLHAYGEEALARWDAAPAPHQETACRTCKGSGEVTGLTWGHGPDDYEVTGPCPTCDGSGDARPTPNQVTEEKPAAWMCSERKNAILSAAQFENCLPKNRATYTIPLYPGKPVRSSPALLPRPLSGLESGPEKSRVALGMKELRELWDDSTPPTAPHQEPGWVRVPVAPTPEMISRALDECSGIGGGSCGERAAVDGDDMISVWESMISAAIKEPKP